MSKGVPNYLEYGPEGLYIERRGRASGTQKGLIACKTQTTSPIGCLNYIFV